MLMNSVSDGAKSLANGTRSVDKAVLVSCDVKLPFHRVQEFAGF